MATEVIVKKPVPLHQRLWTMKNSKEFCDAVVIINGKTIPVHKVVLASASKYFKDLFGKSDQNVASFTNVDGKVMEMLLQYCYTGKIKITLKNVMEVIALARILSINEIIDQSLKEFEKTHIFDDCSSGWNVDQLGAVEKMHGYKQCSPQERTTLVAIGDSLVKNTQTIEMFDPANGKWVEIEINCKKTGFSSTYLDDRLFIIGGMTVDKKTSNVVEGYNFKSGEVEIFPPLIYARWGLRAVQTNGIIFVIGGANRGNLIPQVEKFDPANENWIVVAPMSICRFLFGAAVLGDEIYVAGGLGIEYKMLSSTEAYSIAENRWRSRARLNVDRADHGLAEVGGYLYAVGGKDDKYNVLNSVEVYDKSIDKWTMLDESIDPPRFSLAAANYMGKLLIAGGVLQFPVTRDNLQGILQTVETFNPEEKKWKSFASMKNKRLYLNLIEIPISLSKDVILKKKRA